MSDLMRKEFEVWAESRGMDLYCSRKNIYVESETLWAWSSWKASRECLMVELPADAHLSRDGLDEHYLAGDMRDQIVESIHAAGVKTK